MKYKRFEMIQLSLNSEKKYFNPFTDVEVFCRLVSPVGEEKIVQGFYDGENTWKIRFTPTVEGIWTYKTYSLLANKDFDTEGELIVEESLEAEKGFLRAVPGKGWGLEFDNGEAVMVIGDTMYNIYGVAHGGSDIVNTLKRRKEQGFNMIRVRVPVSNFHPTFPVSTWQKRPTWLWGGSAECPEYGSFNLEYFKTVDEVMLLLEELGMGAEVILEAWLFERPFNDRNNFIPEYEELYIKYVTARLSAYKSVYMWTTANEYNLYPKLDPNMNYVSERYAKRLARIIREADIHGHPIAVHVTQSEKMEPSFKERFRHITDVDILLLQTWGARDEDSNWDLAKGIDEDIETHCTGSNKVNILAEYGYEDFPSSKRSPDWMVGLSAEHNRRGAWRGAMMGVHVISGFENTWGVYFTDEMEPSGAGEFIYLKKFFSEVVDFQEFTPNRTVLNSDSEKDRFRGCKTLCMSNRDSSSILAYLPAGGTCELSISDKFSISAEWYDNQTGALIEAKFERLSDNIVIFKAPEGQKGIKYPKDWVLKVTKHEL
jgi:hypothetical protein